MKDLVDIMSMRPEVLKALQDNARGYDSLYQWLSDLALFYGKVRVIRAIRLLRDMGLAEAKDWAEELFENEFEHFHRRKKCDDLFRIIQSECNARAEEIQE